MFFKTAACALALAVTSLNATAQIETDSMGDISAWGTRYMKSGEKEFPTRLWNGSDEDVLLDLMKSVRTQKLTPAERTLLRRVVLSPTQRPSGKNAEALLAERARLMLALGEARAAAALAPKLKQDARGLDAQTLAIDLDMASGNEASACRRLSGPVPEGEYWLKLRAVCAVLQENFSGAELAVEVATAQGLTDPWFLEAIFAASGDVPNPPFARFDTGLNIALSSKANLDTQRVTLSSSRPDLAAAAASRRGVPNELRARFAQIAGEIDLITPEERRGILLARLKDEDYTASSAIEQALELMANPTASPRQQAERLNSILETASRADMARFGGTSRLFLADLKRLPKARDTAPYAKMFTLAAMAAGDSQTARAWLGATEFEGMANKPDPFEIAALEALDLILGGDDSPASQRAIQTRLIEAAKPPRLKREAARILTLWTGFGHPLSQDGRALLASEKSQGKRIDPYTLLAIDAASRSGAIGETALMILDAIDGEPEALNPADTAALIAALRRIDAEDVASALALEATAFWKKG
jgi:hypothetical protein